MPTQLPFLHYFIWHYSRGVTDMFRTWLNILWFVFHFFSIGVLIKTFFTPFKRRIEKHESPGLEDWASAVISNIVLRIVGAVIRSVILAVGLIVLFVTFVVAAIHVVSWFLLPVFIIGLLVMAFAL